MLKLNLAQIQCLAIDSLSKTEQQLKDIAMTNPQNAKEIVDRSKLRKLIAIIFLIILSVVLTMFVIPNFKEHPFIFVLTSIISAVITSLYIPVLGNQISNIINLEDYGLLKTITDGLEKIVEKAPKNKFFYLGLIGLLLMLFFLVIPTYNPSYKNLSADYVTYIIDNSGSMGCQREEDLEEDLTKGRHCRSNIARKSKVELAKKWIENDFINRNEKIPETSLIEIGGGKSVSGECKITPRLKPAIHNFEEMKTALEKVRANDIGATDIGGAIIQAVKEIKESAANSGFNLSQKSKQIIVVTDLDDSCANSKVSFKAIVEEVKKEGFALDFKDVTITFYALAPYNFDEGFNTRRREIELLKKQGIEVIPIQDYKAPESLSEPSYAKRIIAWILLILSIFIAIPFTNAAAKLIAPDKSYCRIARIKLFIPKPELYRGIELYLFRLDNYGLPISRYTNWHSSSPNQPSFREPPYLEFKQETEGNFYLKIIEFEENCQGYFLVTARQSKIFPNISRPSAKVRIELEEGGQLKPISLNFEWSRYSGNQHYWHICHICLKKSEVDNKKRAYICNWNYQQFPYTMQV